SRAWPPPGRPTASGGSRTSGARAGRSATPTTPGRNQDSYSPGEGGRIICIGSPTGQRGTFGQTNYAAAKAGIVGMVRTWALELKRAGITANTVVPVAATAMTATVPYFAAAVRAEADGEPMPAFFRHDLGFGTVDDVAGLVAFLASDAAAKVTGQVIGVGGDRLQIWTHPEAALTAYREGGWTYDALVEAWPTTFDGATQSVGERFPELPARFQPATP
ncbi:SDR family oxidoreductase, partial [Streptomyces sp. NPDC052644]